MSDLISRQAAIDVFKNLIGIDCIFEGNPIVVGALIAVKEAITQLPAAEPEQKKGKWLETEAAPHRIYCSECFATYVRNKEWLAWKDHIVPRKYCPNCGAKMEEEK